MTKKIALTGGGTGGHVYPLISIYNYFKKDKSYSFVWVGENNSLEKKIASKNNIDFLNIFSGKLRRYFSFANFIDPFKIFFGIIQGIFYIKKYKIDIIFSKGGFVSLPLCFAGKIMNKKIYIHESDTVIGLSNKIISKLANKVFFTFPNSKIDGKKYILTGQILNPELSKNIGNNYTKNKTLEILIIAGSQGSTIIFDAIKNIINNFPTTNFCIILGEKNLHFKKEFNKFKNITIYDFVTQQQISQIYQKTDIAITRGGATSLWELYHFGIKQIIIPLKNSAGNHQFTNGKYFKKNHSSILLEEDNNLAENIQKLLEKLKKYRKEKLNLENIKTPLKTIKEKI